MYSDFSIKIYFPKYQWSKNWHQQNLVFTKNVVRNKKIYLFLWYKFTAPFDHSSRNGLSMMHQSFWHLRPSIKWCLKISKICSLDYKSVLNFTCLTMKFHNRVHANEHLVLDGCQNIGCTACGRNWLRPIQDRRHL